MREGIRIGVMLLALCWIALQDIKRNSVGRMDLVVVSMTILAVGFTERVDIRLRAGGLIFGLLVLCICKLSAEALGFADGILILIFGVSFGLFRVSFLCFVSFLFSAAGAGVLYLAGKVGKKSRIPFLPFLLAGYLVSLALGAAIMQGKVVS